MMHDPAIEQIRKIRHKISAQYNHDPKRLIEHLMELQKKHPKRILKTATKSKGFAKRENLTFPK